MPTADFKRKIPQLQEFMFEMHLAKINPVVAKNSPLGSYFFNPIYFFILLAPTFCES
jgi:hypothetical protein